MSGFPTSATATPGLARDLATARAVVESQAREISELNHRIANSLQLAADMLMFEQLRSQVPAARTALEASRARLVAVGALHRYLHDQVDRASVDLGVFLRGLSGAISASTGLRASAEAEAMMVDGNMAQQIGIIVNECAINTAKHAYPDRVGGRLVIRAGREGASLIVSVADQGRGLGGDAPVGKAGLGMTIVRAMVRDLHGDLSLHDDDGLTVRLRVPLSTPGAAEWSFQPLRVG